MNGAHLKECVRTSHALRAFTSGKERGERAQDDEIPSTVHFGTS